MFRKLTLLVLVLLSSTSMAFAQAAPSPPVIVTQGEAILKRAPDRAWLAVATEQRASQPAEARRKSAEAMTAVQSALKAAGVAAEAIRTTSYSLMPEMDWVAGRSTLRGYVVRNQIEVRVDDLDRLPAILDAANVPKAAGLSIIGPRFDLKNQQAVENEARRLAVEIAMERAQALATGARRAVGSIVRIEDHDLGGMPKPMPMARMTMTATAAPLDTSTPISPGEIEVRATVTLTVEIR